MDNNEVKRLREKHVKYSRDLGKAQDALELSEMTVAIQPWNPIVRLAHWLIRKGHKWLEEDELKARIEARKTFQD